MLLVGQIALLCAFVAAGFAAFACFAGSYLGHRRLERTGLAAGIASVALLTAVSAILACALVLKDFRFAYVAEYSDRLLPWHYSLSAFWVGQAGSLLLWAWLLGILAIVYRLGPGRDADSLRAPAFGVLMGYLGFLVAVMVFAADPMQPSIAAPGEGAGLSPLLQHPAMLLHPPIVFLGYAGWAIPSALALAMLVTGRFEADWARLSRPWSLFSWSVLGLGILLGADWAYEELGWGGYWSWDPVENGSLIPWLTGTALVHTSLAWQYRGVLRKTALSLAVATFALCNFATFLTRSGIFSSLHAFSQSPIGWMFLALMLFLGAGGVVLLALRRRALAPRQPIASLWTRESLVVVSGVALVLLAAVATVGTAFIPLSKIALSRQIMVGPAFYNRVLIPIGLVLMATTALAPLVRWGKPPSVYQKRMLLGSLAGGLLIAGLALGTGVRHPIALAVTALAAVAIVALAGALVLDLPRQESLNLRQRLLQALGSHRRRYAGFLIHVGFVCLAVGVTGTSLGTRQREVVIREGQTVHWAGRSIRYARLIQRELSDKLVVEAQLEISEDGRGPYRLLPAQHFYRRQNGWTTEVAIHSTWGGDFYAILHGNEGQDRASFTLLENPLIRWLWLSGGIACVGTLIALWPAGQAAARRVPDPHFQPMASTPRQRSAVLSSRAS